MSYLLSDAKISVDGVYRYLLERRWDEGAATLWIGLNPSTADGREDDPTIRRMVGFSRQWGDAGILVVNLYALRATNPRELAAHSEPVGFAADTYIALTARGAARIVCCWGSNADLDRVAQVLSILPPRTLYCLGMTATNQPRHPLYLPKDTGLQIYRR